MPVRGDTQLQADDVVTLLIDGNLSEDVTDLLPSPVLDADLLALVSQDSPKRVTGSVASAHSSASAAVRRDLRRTYQNAPPATAPTASTTFRSHGILSTFAGRVRWLAALATRCSDFGPVQCRSMRRLPGALAGLVLVLAACGVSPASQPQPGLTPGTEGAESAAVGSANSAGTPAPDGTAGTPGDVSDEQRFTFDDVAEFDDGLLIEIAGTVADKASKTDRGAEATDGQIVIASIRIENNTKKSYDARNALIGARYGEGQDAQIIVDKTDELKSGFTGKIKAKDEGIASCGFAVPWKELKKVTIVRRPE